MKKWWVVLFLAIQFLMVRSALAQTEPAAASSAASPTAATALPAAVAVDECKDTLPQMESDYSQVIMDIRNLNQNLTGAHEEYLKSFQQMTQALVDLSLKKEDDLKKIMESREALQQAMQKFSEDDSQENSKAVQDNYMNLTVRLYAQAMEGSNTVEALKSQLIGVEEARAQYENSQKSQADLDAKKLDLEGKLASLKIRCQKN
jgi:hypothetical protein